MTILRRYCVYTAYAGRQHSHLVEGESFEAAALSFVEQWHPAIDGGDEVAIVVREADTGREVCFHVDMQSGQTAPCT